MPQDGGGKSTCHPPGHDKDGDADHADDGEDDPPGHDEDHVDINADHDHADVGDDDAMPADLDKNVQRSVFGIPGMLDLRLPVTDGNSEED